MIEYTTGNILDAPTDAIVNTVNCEGYMGKGIAYQFKLKYPHNNAVYTEACKTGSFQIGRVLVVKENNTTVINFPTKNKWRAKSEYGYIEKGLISLKDAIVANNIQSIAIPPLGCGNGGLDWMQVKKIIVNELLEISTSIRVLIYEPSLNISQYEKPKKLSKLNLSHLLLMGIKSRLRKFNKLRLQKTAYLVNYFSNQSYFRFEAHHFGPYAHSLEILSKDIKEYQSYYGFTTEMAYEHAKTVLVSSNIISKENLFVYYLDKATAYVNTIQNDKDLELITTLLFIIENKYWISLDNLIISLQSWSDYKNDSFSEDMIILTVDKLVDNELIQKSLLGLAPFYIDKPKMQSYL